VGVDFVGDVIAAVPDIAPLDTAAQGMAAAGEHGCWADYEH
jgi:hypothetical protein